MLIGLFNRQIVPCRISIPVKVEDIKTSFFIFAEFIQDGQVVLIEIGNILRYRRKTGNTSYEHLGLRIGLFYRLISHSQELGIITQPMRGLVINLPMFNRHTQSGHIRNAVSVVPFHKGLNKFFIRLYIFRQ
ncbi:MAG: hypothetical protein D3910_12225, partial [Candidatus Electrothrix sp. ATG2]|nr:hypothetical protein [Candidatus Electrothrix sp. ATG2]